MGALLCCGGEGRWIGTARRRDRRGQASLAPRPLGPDVGAPGRGEGTPARVADSSGTVEPGRVRSRVMFHALRRSEAPGFLCKQGTLTGPDGPVEALQSKHGGRGPGNAAQMATICRAHFRSYAQKKKKTRCDGGRAADTEEDYGGGRCDPETAAGLVTRRAGPGRCSPPLEPREGARNSRTSPEEARVNEDAGHRWQNEQLPRTRRWLNSPSPFRKLSTGVFSVPITTDAASGRTRSSLFTENKPPPTAELAALSL
ncbi:hypothetical protein SKAU_G00129640 [Synaphobranchus kaupii]|uniref:Uncharacterized protein n=1 Tax=Synaphobranchus kaupii TaxID=118154 RepID=A0A9Q1FR55_SYNKA|nr:hypothetical protein SKAU_G00129640 [Synaphobranchus kaupii]